MSCWICATIESALDDMAVLLLHNRWVVLPIIAQSRRSFNATMFTCRFRIRPHGLWSHSYGIAPNGKQKYRCRTCRRQSRENPGSAAYAPERKEEILRAYQERSRLRGLERTFGVARSTVISWLKKSPLPLTSPNDLDRS